MVPNASGVFQRIKLKEHAVIRAFGGYWTEQTKAIHTINQSIPFKLTNETVEIEIIEAISAEIIGEMFRKILSMIYNFPVF